MVVITAGCLADDWLADDWLADDWLADDWLADHYNMRVGQARRHVPSPYTAEMTMKARSIRAIALCVLTASLTACGPLDTGDHATADAGDHATAVRDARLAVHESRLASAQDFALAGDPGAWGAPAQPSVPLQHAIDNGANVQIDDVRGVPTFLWLPQAAAAGYPCRRRHRPHGCDGAASQHAAASMTLAAGPPSCSSSAASQTRSSTGSG